jgi:hypothetical protein
MLVNREFEAAIKVERDAAQSDAEYILEDPATDCARWQPAARNAETAPADERLPPCAIAAAC